MCADPSRHGTARQASQDTISQDQPDKEAVDDKPTRVKEWSAQRATSPALSRLNEDSQGHCRYIVATVAEGHERRTDFVNRVVRIVL